jgi:sugar lactone lactonase YvrE
MHLLDQVVPIPDSRSSTGQAPLWVPKGDRWTSEGWWWVDATAPRERIRRCYVPGFKLPETVIGRRHVHDAFSLVLTRQGGLIVVGRDGIRRFTSDSMSSPRLLAVNPSSPTSQRIMDGVVAPDGTLWYCAQYTTNSARLYRFNGPGVRPTVLRRAFATTRGLAWAPDRGEMWWTTGSTIRAIGYEDGGSLEGESRVAVDFSELVGGVRYVGDPTGATFDADGNYWVVMTGGGCVLCITQDGTVIRRVDLPVENPTGVCFGGEGLRTLCITTSCYGLPHGWEQRWPDAGYTFRVETNIAGLPARTVNI